MTDFLLRIFLGDRRDMEDAKTRERAGTLSGIVGIAVNLLLSAAKLVAGILSSSAAVVADAVNNMSDAGSSLISLVSFRISGKPADRKHPFGHARMEYIASMIVSFLILLVGTELLFDSFRTLFGLGDGGTVEITLLTILILVASVLAKLWLALFYRKVGKMTDSSVIRAAAADSLSDCASTLAVLICSLIIRYTGWVIVDAIVGLAVSALILIAGVRILNETKNSLLGEAPVDETVKAIEAIVSEYTEVVGVHDLLVHNYGPGHLFATFHAEVDGDGNIYHLHDVMDNLEREIREKLGILCTVHMDPVALHDERVSALCRLAEECAAAVDPSITIHDFRAVIGTTHTNLIFDIVLPFESRITPDEACEAIGKEVAARHPDYYCVITVDRG